MLVSFGDSTNARIEYITFNVVDIYYPYNAIFGRGFTKKFNAIIHSAYLCMKMPALKGAITIFRNQKEVREIERHTSMGQGNVNTLQSNKEPQVSSSQEA